MGDSHWRWWGWFKGVLLFYHFSIHHLVFDFSVFVVWCSVPWSPILPFPHILIIIIIRECSLTMKFPILPTPYILCYFRFSVYYETSDNQCSKTIRISILYLTLILCLSLFTQIIRSFEISKSFLHMIRVMTRSIKSFTFVIISNQRRRKKEWEEDEYMSHLVSH